MEQETSEFSSGKIASDRQELLDEVMSSETEDFGNENDEEMVALGVNQEENPGKKARFGNVSEEKKTTFQEAAVNRNTKKSTETWLRTYLEWAEGKKKPKNIESLSTKDLDDILGDFYTDLKKKDGSIVNRGNWL